MTRQERLQQLRDLLERGKSPAEASRYMGVSRATVSGLMSRNKEFFRGYIRTEAKPKGSRRARSAELPPDIIPDGELTPLKTLEETGPQDCRFMIGQSYCGRKITRGAYCAHHAERCYNKPTYSRVAHTDMSPYALPAPMRNE